MFMMMKKQRKAQMEMIGLVVIIIMMSLGLMFYLILTTTTEQPSKKKVFSSNQLSTNFVIALHNTETTCGLETSRLIYHCASGSVGTCSGRTYCNYLEDEIDTVLNRTLDKWQVPYNLRIKETDIKFKNKNCTEEDERFKITSQPIPLTPDPRDAEIRLFICK